MDISAFRLQFPEFNVLGKYPDSLLNSWAVIAEAQVRECAWKKLTYFGVFLYVAHEITLAGQNNAIAANGGTPGSSSGPTASKAVGSASISYDTAQGAEAGAGWWNLTTYGKQYYRLSRMFGAGALQIGAYGLYGSGGYGPWQ